ncbi:MAG: fibronectin type III domain-containing protein [Mangrovibacterium sp.]
MKKNQIIALAELAFALLKGRETIYLRNLSVILLKQSGFLFMLGLVFFSCNQDIDYLADSKDSGKKIVLEGSAAFNISAAGDIKVEDSFNYTPSVSGDLVAQSGGVWGTFGTGDPIFVTDGNVDYPGMPSDGNKISIGGKSKGYFRAFTGQSTGSIYGSLVFRVTVLPTGAKGDYFMQMGNENVGTPAVFIKPGGAAGKFKIGLGKRNDSPVTWLENELELNTPYHLVIANLFISGAANDICKLWLNPPAMETAADLQVSAGADLASFVNQKRITFTHSVNAGNDGINIDIDEVRVTNYWYSITLPSAPVNLIAKGSSTSSIDLSWQDMSNNETGFEIERSSNGIDFTRISTVEAGKTAYTDNELSSATKYYFRVRATGPAGSSEYTNVADATTGSDATVPVAPETLKATATYSTFVSLSWRDNSNNETGFEIERSLDGTAFTLLTTVAPNSSAYKDENDVTPSTTYYYRVRAAGKAGNSEYSNVSNATTTAGIPPAPGSLTATAVPLIAVKLNWMDNSVQETGFEIERSADGLTFSLLATVTTNMSTYTDNGLMASSVYYYRVRATGLEGNSDYTEIATVTTHTDFPLSPGNLEAVSMSSSSIRLSWTDNSNNETWFEIERSTDGNAFVRLTTVEINAVNYTDNQLDESTTYYYRIRANGLADHSEYSNIAQATTGVKVYDKIEAGNLLTTNGDGKNDVWVIKNIGQYPASEVKVFDRTGRLVFSEEGYKNDWKGIYNNSYLPTGTYTYAIETGIGEPSIKGTLTIIHN